MGRLEFHRLWPRTFFEIQCMRNTNQIVAFPVTPPVIAGVLVDAARELDRSSHPSRPPTSGSRPKPSDQGARSAAIRHVLRQWKRLALDHTICRCGDVRFYVVPGRDPEIALRADRGRWRECIRVDTHDDLLMDVSFPPAARNWGVALLRRILSAFLRANAVAVPAHWGQCLPMMLQCALDTGIFFHADELQEHKEEIHLTGWCGIPEPSLLHTMVRERPARQISFVCNARKDKQQIAMARRRFPYGLTRAGWPVFYDYTRSQ